MYGYRNPTGVEENVKGSSGPRTRGSDNNEGMPERVRRTYPTSGRIHLEKHESIGATIRFAELGTGEGERCAC
jgi:hypothetical protein